MARMYIKFRVDGMLLNQVGKTFLVNGIRGCVGLQFDFCNIWSSYTKQAVIECDNVTYTYDIDQSGAVHDLDDAIFNKAGKFSVTVKGSGSNGAIKTNAVFLTINSSDF